MPKRRKSDGRITYTNLERGCEMILDLSSVVEAQNPGIPGLRGDFFISTLQTKTMHSFRVSVQGDRSLGGHFACLCRGFEFY